MCMRVEGVVGSLLPGKMYCMWAVISSLKPYNQSIDALIFQYIIIMTMPMVLNTLLIEEANLDLQTRTLDRPSLRDGAIIFNNLRQGGK